MGMGWGMDREYFTMSSCSGCAVQFQLKLILFLAGCVTCDLNHTALSRRPMSLLLSLCACLLACMCVCVCVCAYELQKYNIDIAALSETRVHGNSQFEEAAAGYTFFLTGHPTDGPSQTGVGFAIRSSLLKRIESRPVGHNPRIMSWTFNYTPAYAVTVISAICSNTGNTCRCQE